MSGYDIQEKLATGVVSASLSLADVPLNNGKKSGENSLGLFDTLSFALAGTCGKPSVNS